MVQPGFSIGDNRERKVLEFHLGRYELSLYTPKDGKSKTRDEFFKEHELAVPTLNFVLNSIKTCADEQDREKFKAQIVILETYAKRKGLVGVDELVEGLKGYFDRKPEYLNVPNRIIEFYKHVQ